MQSDESKERGVVEEKKREEDQSDGGNKKWPWDIKADIRDNLRVCVGGNDCLSVMCNYLNLLRATAQHPHHRPAPPTSFQVSFLPPPFNEDNTVTYKQPRSNYCEPLVPFVIKPHITFKHSLGWEKGVHKHTHALIQTSTNVSKLASVQEKKVTRAVFCSGWTTFSGLAAASVKCHLSSNYTKTMWRFKWNSNSHAF